MTTTRKRARSVRTPKHLVGMEHIAFLGMLDAAKIARPVGEFRFAHPRRWRFDYAWPAAKVALEVEGGAFSRGRHVRGVGFLNDCEKYSEAAALGWRIVRVPPHDLCATRTVEWVQRAMLAGADGG